MGFASLTLATAVAIARPSYKKATLIEQRHRPRPAGRAGFDLVREAGDGEAVGRQLLEIAQLLYVAIGDLAAGLVSLPDDRRVARLQPARARVDEGRVQPQASMPATRTPREVR